MTLETVEDAVGFIEDRFWHHYESNADLREALEGKDRTILLDVRDGPSYHVLVVDGVLEAVQEGAVEDPDVRIIADRDDLLDVLNRDVHPVAAYLRGKVKVRAPVRDLMLVKAFL